MSYYLYKHILQMSVLLFLIVLIFAGCRKNTETPDDAAEQTDSQTTAESVQSPETDPPVILPDSFYIPDDESLRLLAADPDFLGYEGIPTVTIGYNVTENVSVTFPRACNLTFRGWFEGKITVQSREEAEIVLRGGTESVFLDTPLCDVLWDDADADAALRINARTLNKTPLTLGGEGTAALSGMTLLQANGTPYTDTDFSIAGNVVTLRIPYFMNDAGKTRAALTFTSDTGEVRWSSGQNDDGTVDLTVLPRLTVRDSEGRSRTYQLQYERYRYDLPVMEIHTENNAPILTKLDYVPAVFFFDGREYEAMVKGRGNSSWTQFPKKSYSVKLAEKAALIDGCAESKSWSLVSAYCDKSLIRNEVADALCRVMENIEYVPGQILCDVWLNGEYIGVYTFSEKIEAADGRLNLGAEGTDTPENVLDLGFLIEMGWDYDGRNLYNWDYFDVRYALRLYIKEPFIEAANNPQLCYIRNYIQVSENAIVTLNGYEDYIDVDNFADWFILTELTCNTESVFYRSCYMYKRAGGLLRLGPLWDFDMAFGNYLNENKAYNTWITEENRMLENHTSWMSFLLKDETFMNTVRTRWAEKKDQLLQAAMSEIDRQSALAFRSQEVNFAKWKILGIPSGLGGLNDSVYNTYEKQIEYLRTFIQSRWLWMDSQLTL